MAGGARRSRAAASAKREQGIKKKAWELATLCGVDVCLLGVDPEGNLFFWPDDVSELRRITHRYLDAVEGGRDDDYKAPGGKEKKRKRVSAEVGNASLSSGPPSKKQGRGPRAKEDAPTDASPSPAGVEPLVPAPPVVPLPSPAAWICTSCAAAVDSNDYGSDVGEDMLCLMRSPSREDLPPFDMEPRPTTEDGSGGFPIPAGVLFPCKGRASQTSSVGASSIPNLPFTFVPRAAPSPALADALPSPALVHNRESLRVAAFGSPFPAAPFVPLPSFPEAWSCTSPAAAAAVDLDDYGGDVGEDLPCLLSSSRRKELPCDPVPLPTFEDAGGEFPILGGIFLPHYPSPAPADPWDASWMCMAPPETVGGRGGVPAFLPILPV